MCRTGCRAAPCCCHEAGRSIHVTVLCDTEIVASAKSKLSAVVARCFDFAPAGGWWVGRAGRAPARRSNWFRLIHPSPPPPAAVRSIPKSIRPPRVIVVERGGEPASTSPGGGRRPARGASGGAGVPEVIRMFECTSVAICTAGALDPCGVGYAARTAAEDAAPRRRTRNDACAETTTTTLPGSPPYRHFVAAVEGDDRTCRTFVVTSF